MDYASDEVKLIPGVNVISNRLNQIVFQPFWPVIPANDNVRAEVRPLGIGDLKVVKQKLQVPARRGRAHRERSARRVQGAQVPDAGPHRTDACRDDRDDRGNDQGHPDDRAVRA